MQTITGTHMRALSSCHSTVALHVTLIRRRRTPIAPARVSYDASATFTDGRGEVGEATFADSRPRANVLDETAEFLQLELPRIFRTGEITTSRYAEDVVFEDPVTRFTDKNGYMIMVRALKTLFNVKFELHDVQATQPDQITTRWSMTMKVWELPWQPTLLFSGRSFYQVDPATGLILSHRDVWDSLDNNNYLSPEAVALVIRQLLQVQLTPDLEQPDYQLLKAMKDYEIRRYEPFIVAETALPAGETPASGSGFMDLAGYIFGGNSQSEKMEMTTPVYTRSPAASGRSTTSMQFPMESKFPDVDTLPEPNSNKVVKKQIPGRYVAAIRFSGLPFDWEVTGAERQLRQAVIRDGLQPAAGYSLARYNEPFVPPPLRRNEVLIDLVDCDWPMP
eukprot:GHUV01002072.1.p1 GENE.GHUV01002072.1~~GHUV01002072.1.p1  ORF type:complete len:392 (+),score=97.89 GHUV01002072.1:162-1337(+)